MFTVQVPIITNFLHGKNEFTIFYTNKLCLTIAFPSKGLNTSLLMWLCHTVLQRSSHIVPRKVILLRFLYGYFISLLVGLFYFVPRKVVLPRSL